MTAEIVRILCEHQYEVIKEIGNGNFGVCYLVKSFKFDMEFVCKVSRIEKSTPVFLDCMKQEAEILAKLNHPNIVSIYDYFFENHTAFIILEYCPNGSLIDLINKQGRLSTRELERFALEIISALDFLHKKGIAHCDIKLSNILIDNFGRAKICDFGLSRISLNGEKDKKDLRGSIHYMSPEMLSHATYDMFKADVWAIGVLLYVANVGSFPYGALNPHTILDDIYNNPRTLSDKYGPIADVVNLCLTITEASRPTMSQIYAKACETLSRHTHFKSQSTSKVIPTLAKHSIIKKRRLSNPSSTIHDDVI